MSRAVCDGRDMCARVVELEQERREWNALRIDLQARIGELEQLELERPKTEVMHVAAVRCPNCRCSKCRQLELELVGGAS